MAENIPFDCDSHKLDGAALSFLDSGGDKQTLHFYHANGFPVSVYLPMMTELTSDFRVVGMGLRGQDAQTKGSASWHKVADDLISFLDAKKFSQIIGVGHSIGGAATMLAAAKRPDLFKKIILIDPAILPPSYVLYMAILRITGQKNSFFLAKRARGRRNRWHDHQAAYDYLKSKALFRQFEDEWLRSYVTYGMKPSPGGGVELVCPPDAEAAIFANYPLDIWRWPGRVKVPALIIRGEKTDVFLERAANRLIRLIKGSEYRIVEDAGHLIPMEKPEQIISLIRDSMPLT